MGSGSKRPGFIGALGAFFCVGALGGGLVGLVELPLRAHLTRAPIFGPVADGLLKALAFAGFYACLFGALGIAAGLVFGWVGRWYEHRRPSILAAYLLAFEILVLYVSVPVNQALPNVLHPKSLAVNALMLAGAVVLAFVLFFATGRKLSGALPDIGAGAKTGLLALAVVLCLAGSSACVILTLRAPDHPPLPSAQGAGPNVLMVSVDTLRADHLPCYGYPHIKTPAINRLAGAGTVFENAFSTTSWTLPACATLATGRTPRALHLQKSDDTLPLNVRTLAEAMSQSGRNAVAVSANPFVSREYGFDRGFHRFINVHDRDRRPGLAGIFLFDNIFRLRCALDDAANVTRLVFKQLEDLAGKPFFLWVHYMDPHKPYGGPWPLELPEYDKGYDGSILFVYGRAKPVNRRREPLTEADLRHVRALYDSDIVRFDRHFSMLLDRMDRLGLMENTLLVFVSDHGEEFLEHGDFEHGTNLHVEQTHVPLIFAGPGVPQGVRVPSRVSILGLPKTVCHLAGVPAPETFSGETLFPLPADSLDRDVMGELQTKGRMRFSMRYAGEEAAGEFDTFDKLRADPFDPFDKLRAGKLRAGKLTSGRLLLYDAKDGRRQLFDLHADPGETDDLSSQQAEQTAEAFEKLQQAINQENLKSRQVEKGGRVSLNPDSLEKLKALGYLAN